MPDTISRAVRTSLVFTVKDNPAHIKEKPYRLLYVPEEGVPTSNIRYEFIENILIRDMRGQSLTFRENGMMAVPLHSQLRYDDYGNKDFIERVYLKEVRNCLREVLETRDVYIFEYMIRRRDEFFPRATGKPYFDRQPVLVAHVDMLKLLDYTPGDVEDRIRRLFGEKAAHMLSRNVVAVNVWKPLKGPLRDWPLALCDSSSLSIEDLVATDSVDKATVAEVYHVHHNRSQRWYYLSDQTESEVIVFSGYDSRSSGRSKVAHCAFSLPDTRNGEVPRESIEVRALAFYDV